MDRQTCDYTFQDHICSC